MKRFVVIAGNHAQFLDWCRWNNVDPECCVYVDEYHQMLGPDIKNMTLVKTGTYEERPDYWLDMLRELKYLRFHNVVVD